MENKKLRIALRLAVEHIACCSDTCYYCDPNWRSKCQCVDDYCSDDCLKLIETCLLNEADELIRKEDVQTCRMFDITMDELKSSNSKEVCYACGYDAEDLVKQIAELEKKNDKLGTDLYNAENIVSDLQQQLAEKDLKIERLKQDYDEVWEDTLFRVEEEFRLNNNCSDCERYYIKEFNKKLVSFAVEQLEKVRKEFETRLTGCKWEDKMLVGKLCNTINDVLDNQIKQLKKEKQYEPLIIKKNGKLMKKQTKKRETQEGESFII